MTEAELDARLRLGQPVFCTSRILAIDSDAEGVCGGEVMVFPVDVDVPYQWSMVCRRCGILGVEEVSMEQPEDPLTQGEVFYAP